MSFYIQDTRQYVGNCVLWWAHERKGYTTEIDKAGVFTEEEAHEITRNRKTDRAWPKDVVDARVSHHVRAGALCAITLEEEETDAR